jgi:hypothetical protein
MEGTGMQETGDMKGTCDMEQTGDGMKKSEDMKGTDDMDQPGDMKPGKR